MAIVGEKYHDSTQLEVAPWRISYGRVNIWTFSHGFTPPGTRSGAVGKGSYGLLQSGEEMRGNCSQTSYSPGGEWRKGEEQLPTV